jgi:transketolase
MVYKAKSSHIGSNFSVIDILAVLFSKVDFKKDKIILSAGWKAAAFYYFLAEAGFFPKEWLDTYNQEGSKLIGLTEPGVPGVLFAGGSMQMGLPAAVGFALSKKMKGEDGKVYCILSDGELAGGMIWESALIASHYELKNLVVIIDNNGLQAMGESKNILDSGYPTWPSNSSRKKSCHYRGFDKTWSHDVEKISQVLDLEKEFALDIQYGGPAPFVLEFETIKGKGVSFMENNNLWHYKDISDELYQKALAELQ